MIKLEIKRENIDLNFTVAGVSENLGGIGLIVQVSVNEEEVEVQRKRFELCCLSVVGRR